MEGILHQLDLEHLIEAFEENGVGPREAVTLTDAEFNTLGVTRIGDRARIREKCRNYISGEAAASPVVKKLREMVKGRRGAQPGPSRKTSTTLRVHIGWKHKAKFQKSHKQVIAGKGGGGYDIDLPRDAGITDLKKAVINLFFPQGRNEFQNLNIADLQSYLSTFSGHLLQPSLNSGDPFTMEGYCEEVKTHPVRIYLVTTDERENDSDIDEDDSLPDVFSSGNNTNSSSSSSHRRNNSSSNRRNGSHNSNRSNTNNSNIGSSSSNNTSSSDDRTPSSSGMDIQTAPRECIMQPDTPTITFPQNTLDLNHAACSNVHETIDLLNDTDEELDLEGITMAAVEARNQHLETQASERSCADIIASLMSETAEGDPTTVVVQRRRILNSTMRAVNSSSFSFSSPLQVVFAGEDAEDGGGPRREFFRLLLKEVVNSSGMFQVRENKATFTYDINHLEQRGYKLAGQLMLWSLTHGGPGIAALCPSLFAAMVGKDVDMTDIDCLAEQTTRVNLEKLISCTEAEFSETVVDLADWILEQGVTKIHNVTFAQRDSLVNRLFTHCIYHRVHSAVRQFTEGMGPLWEQVTQNPAEMKALFIYDPQPLAVGDFRKLYDILHSPEGSNNRVLEEDTVYCWELFLQKCADINTDVSLEDILEFWTAARKVPPCGFENKPSIEFYPKVSGIRRFPSSCTCVPIMWLPRGIEDPDEFQDLMTCAIKGSHGFGKV